MNTQKFQFKFEFRKLKKGIGFLRNGWADSWLMSWHINIDTILIRQSNNGYEYDGRSKALFR